MTDTWQHPDVLHFLDIMGRARALYPEYERTAREFVSVVRQLDRLAHDAGVLRDHLAKEGSERLVDSLGWPGQNHRGDIMQNLVRIPPLKHGGSAWQKEP